jgi:hypothetical protein
LLLLALPVLLCGAGIISDGEPTSLPVSSNAGLPTTGYTQPDEMAFTPGDGGMLWLPTPYVEPGDGGASSGARPDAGPPGPCSPIEARIAHRREWLSGVWVKSAQVGIEKAAQAYCEQHVGDPECARPPAVAERDISEVTVQSLDDPPPEIDAWIIRWQKELDQCRAQLRPASRDNHPSASRPPRTR